MSRYAYNNTTVDQNGKILGGATVSLYLTGTTTPAKMYAASAGGTAVYSTTSSSVNGSFTFYVDDGDYATGQKFDIVTTYPGFSNTTISAVAIYNPSASVTIDTDVTLAADSNIVIASQHATKTYADTKIAHSLATAANDFLVASGIGVFVKKTLAEVNTILGLGTAAYLNTGTSASQVVQLNGSAQLPAVDGSLLTGVGLLVGNLKPTVNATANLLDMFTKSGGAVPDATDVISVSIPDATGFTARTRNGSVASGTSRFTMADAANYWSKGSLDAEIKTAWVYAIWSVADGGIVWALGGYSGFTIVPTTATATDDDFFLLEGSSTYSKVATDRCIAVAKIRYQYATDDTPNHTISSSGENAPQVIWNSKSDYGYQKNLATTISQGSDITEASIVNLIVKQSGKYFIAANGNGYATGTAAGVHIWIKTGSGTYGSATYRAGGYTDTGGDQYAAGVAKSTEVYLNAGDTIHLGAAVIGGATRTLTGDNNTIGATGLSFHRID